MHWRSIAVLVFVSLYPLVASAAAPENAVWTQEEFWFRDDDGSEITASGLGLNNTTANENVINVLPLSNLRLRFRVRATQAAGAIKPQLEFKEGEGCTTGIWSTVPATGNLIHLRASENIMDGASTTQQLTSGANFTAGKILEITNPAGSITVPKNDSTEYEWSLSTGQEIPRNTTYAFRITNLGTVLDTYRRCPTAKIEPPAGVKRYGLVSFSGTAFPNGKILLLTRNDFGEKIVSEDKIISDDGRFNFEFRGLLYKIHTLSLLFIDRDGHTTQTKWFNLELQQNTVIEKYLMAPPTVRFLQSSVTRGQELRMVGYASPLHNIMIEIDGIMGVMTTTNIDGFYTAYTYTGGLDFGPHVVRAKQVNPSTKAESDFSLVQAFTVSRIVNPETDLNGDDVVNIQDWSIFLSSWTSSDDKIRSRLDFTRDGKIDISDFSVLIRNVRKN